jgi:hypothetical protein
MVAMVVRDKDRACIMPLVLGLRDMLECPSIGKKGGGLGEIDAERKVSYPLDGDEACSCRGIGKAAIVLALIWGCVHRACM